MEKETNNRKLSIIEYLIKKRCRNIIMSSSVGKSYCMTVNFDLTEKEYRELVNNALNNHDYLLNERVSIITLTKFEYDLLLCYSGNTIDHKFNGIDCLKKLKKQGYFKTVDINMTICEILNNCEVICDVE